MTAESNIIFVTNDESALNILKPKLVLLREIDNIVSVDYKNAVMKTKELRPEVVLLYCKSEKEDALKLISSIKKDSVTKNTSVILILKEFEQDFVLSAYDEDVTDYFLLDADDAEVLTRTIWGFKKNALATSVSKQQTLLEDLGVINKKTGFYSAEFCEKIFETELKGIQNKKDTVLMLVSPSEESKTTLNGEFFAQTIKRCTRNSDVVSHSNLNKFYILLSETNLQGAFKVFDKIKKTLGDDYSINAGVTFTYKKNFEQLKSELLNAISEASSTKEEIVVVNDEKKSETSDWLDKINSNQKNFKLFKQAFIKKLEKVITPVFFQVQKLYEEKLFETKIEQYSNSSLSAFVLKGKDKTSELKITYPGFSKINIDLIHQGLDSPENSRISLDLTELDEKKLTKILENFITEFKKS